jgi:hypothetical protein
VAPISQIQSDRYPTAFVLDGDADAVYYGTKMRGVSNAKAKRDLNFQPRPLEWVVDTAMAHAS